MRRDKKSCSDCRYRITGWDGGFDGEPMTCDCKIYGTTEDRKDCERFKRPFPRGYELLKEFKRFVGEDKVTDEDIERFRREWK